LHVAALLMSGFAPICAPMTIVPYQLLSSETLTRLLEDFVTREGALHGHREFELGDKVDAVVRQLNSGLAAIVFDEVTDSFTITMTEHLPAHGTSDERKLE